LFTKKESKCRPSVVLVIIFFNLSLKMVDFQIGDHVFAKIRGYPFWPARIDEIVRNREDIRYINVFFYGTHQV